MKLSLSCLSPYWLWALFSFPAILMISQVVNSSDHWVFHRMVHPSGEMSARFLVVAMMVTPLCMLFKGWRGALWLKRNRRYLGVAAFGYALLHTVFYFIDKSSVEQVLSEAPRFYIWTGWVALGIFLPLTMTSMDYFVRRMGRNWKTLQRFVYPAAILTLLHWAALHNWHSPTAALVHFGPLAILELFRIGFWLRQYKLRTFNMVKGAENE
ncbi:sulfite oxidase heme-binding subunit YedZ [Pseudovibrio sp. Alg231-02]|uniref:sulfite oxidase heme-binding subunit YedZ n=1 Tax=Pseudovibrio sp. Alg231-02 TaxID=1922223 RepID=UPI000D54BBA6|nr:ferric reductase-like transmembrane domain-containing protein [Pseudovibrio sp. Alg231-02]